MSMKQMLPRAVGMLLLAGVVAVAPLYAGSAVVGSVAGSVNATVGGQALVPNSVIFSGDSLKVQDGAAVIALENGSRMALGRQTEASFMREANGVEVVLGRGDVSLFQADSRLGVAVRAGEYEVAPEGGFKTLGEVAMLNGVVTVTSKQGTLKVVGDGRTVEVAQGKTITLGTKSNRSATPQTGASQNLGGNGSTLLEAGALAAGVVAAILAGVAISHANSATSAANSANSTAAAAVSAANAAQSAAASAANLANLAGCALNTENNEIYGGTVASPYSPPTGYTCP